MWHIINAPRCLDPYGVQHLEIYDDTTKGKSRSPPPPASDPRHPGGMCLNVDFRSLTLQRDPAFRVVAGIPLSLWDKREREA